MRKCNLNNAQKFKIYYIHVQIGIWYCGYRSKEKEVLQ